MQKVRAEISLKNIRYNADRFMAWTGTPLCAVVKANAYGHGGEEVTNALSSRARMFAVALIEEGVAIRVAACGRDILVFTPPTDEKECYHLSVNRFIASVTDVKTAKFVVNFCKKYAKTLRVHIKINTGMNRYGVGRDELNFVCKLLKEEKCVQVEGVYSHLYQTEIAVANKQREEFLFGVMLSKRYFPNVISHLGATYGAMLGKDFAFDLLRVGIGLYGYLPVYQREIQEILTLKKCMRVYAKGVSQREYRLGGVGYGNGVAKPGEILSTYRFGYADGFLRSRKNGLVNWQKNKNDLCMDATIREGAAKIGEWIPIMTDADAVAKETGTIAYEVLCAATRRAEFIYD